MNELYEKCTPASPPWWRGLLYQGVYLFVGAPKVGKSFLMAQLAYHVSKGLPPVGVQGSPPRGRPLYGPGGRLSPLQGRLYRMFGEDGAADFPSIYAKQLNSGLEEQLRRFVREHPDTRLIIIDTLQKSGRPGPRNTVTQTTTIR